ncbi:MAG TPA: cytochrome C oxidase subunit IV family protein [Acetobacteraceae bacterium]|nr:cytochrome C oxidase subunit IV family protein [Acetobacteraceae bacterium]
MKDVHGPAGQPQWHHPRFGRSAPGRSFRRDLRTYLWGLCLALSLTVVPFALVYWHLMTTGSLWIAIGLFALVQAVVHFRCFLHVHPPHENVDEMLLVLFTAVILVMMAGGTVWILGNLHSRMY